MSFWAFILPYNARFNDPVDISDCFDDPRQMQRWHQKTRWVMTEMTAFLRWIDDWLRLAPAWIGCLCFAIRC